MINTRRVISLFLVIAMVVTLIPLNFMAKRTQAAEIWRSALYPENWQPGYTNSEGQFLHDFSYAGYEMGEKELPTQMEGLTADVTQYGADPTGTNDSTAAIQSAINAVQNAGGGIVYLPEGTYKVKPASNSNSSALTISGSNILFKGAGVGKTFIRCYAESMRYCKVINVTNGGSWDSAEDGNTYYLSQDIPTTPTTTVHLEKVGNLKAGDWVIIRSDRTQEWIDEHSMGGFWYETVSPTTMGTTFYRQITSVDSVNNTIEIDIPTRYWMKTRDNARVYKVTPKQSNVGLMDFSIGNKANSNTSGWEENDYSNSANGAYAVDNAFLISFSLNINCFAKNIATYQAGNTEQIHMSSNGLNLSKTRNLTIEECDFSYPQYEGANGNGYGINVCGQETLIKDCSSTSARHSYSFKYAYSSGNVIYHYTSTDPKYGSDFHMYLSMSNLIDNEELNGDYIETNIRPYGGTAGNRHGYTSTQTVFWNTKGNRYKAGINYIIDSRQYEYGYIIGTRGAATAVKTTPTTMSSTYGTVNTAPEDYKEGIGAGDTLYPQSLYYDQLEKRLQRNNAEPEVKVHTIPGTIKATEYSIVSSEITKNTSVSGIDYVGNLVAQSTLEYKTKIEKTGKYRLNINAVSGNNNSTRTLSVYLDDKLLTILTVTNRTDWEDFQDISSEVEISSLGEHTLKVVSSGSVNIAEFNFTKSAETIPGKVSVGAYTNKSDEIKISTNEDVLLAGNLINGSYLEYTVDVQNAGKYNMFMDLATINADRVLTIYVDDIDVGTVTPSATATWFDFQTYKTMVTFVSEGEHKIRISSTGSCNIAKLVFEEKSEETTEEEPTTKEEPKETTEKEPTTKEEPKETITEEPTIEVEPEESITQEVEMTTEKVIESASVQKESSTNTEAATETDVLSTVPQTVRNIEITTREKSDAEKIENEILNFKNDKDYKNATFRKLCAKVKKSTKTSNKIIWKRIPEATKYVVYGAKCGTAYKKLATVTKNFFVHKKLKKGTYYKYIVVAQNDSGDVLTISKLVHTATEGGKVGNCKKIKLNKKKVNLKKQKKFKIKAKQVVKAKKLKIKNHRKIAFESSNSDVAWVSKRGVIKAVKKGKCTIYVYAQNGIYTKLKVTVK